MESQKSLLAGMLTSISCINNKEKFRKEAQQHNLDEWINKHKLKVGSVGLGTGLVGGPLGLLSEAADTGYLGAIMGRLCLGIGHIHRKNVDYNCDMDGILAIWGGAGQGIKTDHLKNRARKNYGEQILHEENFQNYLSTVTINNKIIINDDYSAINQNIRTTILTGTKAGTKVGSKTAIKGGMKIGTKLLAKKLGMKTTPKILMKASAKLSAKIASKMATKWIPIVGGVTSAAINVWVLDTLADAAKEYYNSDYILLSSEISNEAFDEISNTTKDFIDD